jgi:NAD-dependent dihydropyrimidine dehydrogenase PreA subunit
MGRFVEVKVLHPLEGEDARALVGACPVDIFALGDSGRLTVVPEREDECILCGRCVALAGQALSVRRLYGQGREVSAGVSDA